MNKSEIISISMSNTKMGCVPSFSLPPGCSCNRDVGCAKKGCYAMRFYKRFRNVRESYNQNWFMVNKRSEQFVEQVNAWLKMYCARAFRIHVSGDFFSEEYLKCWIRIAKANPKVKFFAFTKQWDVVRSCVGIIPKNLSIILSAWLPETHNWCPPEDLAKKFPIAWVCKSRKDLDLIEDVRDVFKRRKELEPCGGMCEECGKCFSHKKKDGDILFAFH